MSARSSSITKAYQWPENFYTEISDMAHISFLMYMFAYLSESSRLAKEEGVEFEGFEVDNLGLSARKTNTATTTSSLERSFTPGEIVELIKVNLPYLQEKFPADFTGAKLSTIFKRCNDLEDMNHLRGSDTSSLRQYTLEEFEDKFQAKELVYSVVKDERNKRITLVFRGTENNLGAFRSNWLANIRSSVKMTPVPESIKGDLEFEEIGLHSGFYDFLHGETVDETDDSGRTKYDQIVEDVKALLSKYPGFKLYVTGHSLGAALSTVAAFYLTCDKDIPKPVTCLNFASPRVGNASFLKACQHLEKSCLLRMLRVVNSNDTIAVVPFGSGYAHVGFQLTLDKDKWFSKANKPKLHYPNLKLNWVEWAKIGWRNSLLASLNLSYDHGDYSQRLDLPNAREYLEKLDFISLYQDAETTGFELEVLDPPTQEIADDVSGDVAEE
eukprot:scaffold410065_cov50-Attheya_sp.AAC.2